MIHLCQRLVRISSKYHVRATTKVMLVHHKSNGEHPTAGLIVVGDEILKAQVKDTNSFYASNLLYKHGIKVQKISVVQDNIQDIAKEMKYFSESFNYVFTTGGIGPTHDDVTYEGLALAFDDTMHYHPRLVDIVKNRFGYDAFPSPGYKMAYVPTKSILKFGINEATGEAFSYPCIAVQNVFVFPGSPMFFESSFQALCKELFAGHKCFATTEVYINAREESFANILEELARKYSNVSFGSYPEQNRYYKARITIESKNEEDTKVARKMLCSRIPSDVLVQYDCEPHVDCLMKYEKLLQRSERRSIYEKSFEKFVDYYRKPDEVWICLDGSDESVVMIHLARVADTKLRQPLKTKLHGICFELDDFKSDMNGFFEEISDRYDVELCKLRSNEMNCYQEVERLISSRPELRILLVGKRSSANRREIYENLVRLNNNVSVHVQIHFPLSNWANKDVASFVESLSLPYYTAHETRSFR
ncbi:PREDICTED: FAD synthase-like [Dufourea novaeangliae]|uniref:FAD synthase-like n=1 Tax=Dufourea novaeangliae TaxID=178035 RepID=UPI0007670ACE|nr:PREDICTED: FAD synthase-like [Dufourea novaeangliae]